MGSSPITRKEFKYIMCNIEKDENKILVSIRQRNLHYRNFIQFATRKGKKETTEKLLRQSLFNVAKKNKIQFWNSIENAVTNTTISLNVKVKRRGSKNIYIPIKMKDSFSKFLSYSWILNSAKKRHENKFYDRFVNEILETAENKSSTSKKKMEIYKLIDENISNISKK